MSAVKNSSIEVTPGDGRSRSAESVPEKTGDMKSAGDISSHQSADLDVEGEAVQHLKAIKKQHNWDANLPQDVFEDIDEALHDPTRETKLSVAEALMENSPYPEVRAAVRPYDEDLLSNTFRAWTLGLIFTTIGSALNALFSLRNPYIIIPSYVAQVVSYPFGYYWGRFMPNWRFKIFGHEFQLNPGPFTLKEHTMVVIMANATFGGGAAYATDTITAMNGFYKNDFGWGFDILLCISTQMIGFGFAGFFHKYLVAPAAMIWPSNLVNTALFYSLHDHSPPDSSKTGGWTISRYKWFLYVMIGSFVWYWFPGYIAPFLSIFAFVTWIRPNNVVINQVFGGSTGLSLLPITFDWTQISGFNFSPLISPWYAIANTLIGMVVFFWITVSAMHFSGKFYSAHLPMSDSSSYDNTGSTYNVSRILNDQFELDINLYKNYSPLFLSSTFTLAYGLSFASIVAILVHTFLYHGQDIWNRFKSMGEEQEDVHTRLMRKYKPVPIWWYGGVLLGMMAISLGTVLGYETRLSWWAFFVALIIAAVWFIPCGIIQGTTNIQIGLNVITEFLVGYMQPGKPIAMMLFKTYGYITMLQGVFFCQDLKLGAYMKVPPRVTFAAQMVACLWSSIVQVAVIRWALGTIKDVCQTTQVNHYTCPNGRVFFNASVIWGVIGPARIFSPGSIYSPLLWFFLVGFLLPIAFYCLARYFPKTPARYLNAPIILGGSGLIPPATPLNYLTWGSVGFIFNKYIRNKHRGWWMQYNYVTSAGLDIGLALCTILIFLTLQLTNHPFPDWWGTTVVTSTLDAQDAAIQSPVVSGATFGPTSW